MRALNASTAAAHRVSRAPSAGAPSCAATSHSRIFAAAGGGLDLDRAAELLLQELRGGRREEVATAGGPAARR